MTGAPTSLGRPNTQQLKMQSSNISLQPKDPCKCAANTSIVMDGPFCKGSCVKPRPVPIPARLTSRSCCSCCGCRSSCLPTWPTSFCTDLRRSDLSDLTQNSAVDAVLEVCLRLRRRSQGSTTPRHLANSTVSDLDPTPSTAPHALSMSLSLSIYIYCLKHVQIYTNINVYKDVQHTICIHVYTYIYIWICLYLHTNKYICAFMSIHVYTYIYIYMPTCVFTYVYVPVVPHKAVAEVSKIGNL